MIHTLHSLQASQAQRQEHLSWLSSPQKQIQFGHWSVLHTHRRLRDWLSVMKFRPAASQTLHSPVVWSHKGFTSGGFWSRYQDSLGNLSCIFLYRSSLLSLSSLSGLFCNFLMPSSACFLITSEISSPQSSLKFAYCSRWDKCCHLVGTISSEPPFSFFSFLCASFSYEQMALVLLCWSSAWGQLFPLPLE